MKRIYFAAVMMIIPLTGCNNSGTTTAPSTNPSAAANNNAARKLKVSVSNDVSVTQDKTKEFKVSITRTNFKSPVVLSFKFPAGVALVTKELTIPADKDSLDVSIKAAPDAKVMDHEPASVTATAPDEKGLGEDTVNFQVDVKAK